MKETNALKENLQNIVQGDDAIKLSPTTNHIHDVTTEEFNSYLQQLANGKKNINDYLREVLKSNKKFSNAVIIAKFSGKEFFKNYSDLSNLDLSGAILENVDFTKKTLTNANFSNSYLSKVEFKDCGLEGANFVNANSEILGENSKPKVSFTDCSMRNSDLRGMNYEEGKFILVDTELNEFFNTLKKSLSINKIPQSQRQITFTLPEDRIQQKYSDLKLSVPNIESILKNSNKFEKISQTTKDTLQDKIKELEANNSNSLPNRVAKNSAAFFNILSKAKSVLQNSNPTPSLGFGKDTTENLKKNKVLSTFESLTKFTEAVRENLKKDEVLRPLELESQLDEALKKAENEGSRVRSKELVGFLNSVASLNQKEQIKFDPTFNKDEDVQTKKQDVKIDPDTFNSFISQETYQSLQQYITNNNEDLAKDSILVPNLSQIDLSNKEFKGKDFSNCNLTDANLKGSTFTECNFVNACLEGSSLEGSKLNDCNLENAKLQYVRGENITINGSKEKLSNLQNAQFQKANLSLAQISFVDAKQSNWQAANLTKAKITGSDFTGANLNGISARALKIEQSKFIQASFDAAFMKGCEIIRSDLSESSMEFMNYVGSKIEDSTILDANLAHSIFAKCKIENSDLSGTTFNNSVLAEINAITTKFRNAKMKEVDAAYANFKNVTLADANLQKSRLYGALLEQVKAQNTDFSESDLSKIKMKDVDLTETNFTNVHALMPELEEVVFNKATLYGAKLYEGVYKKVSVEQAKTDSETIITSLNLEDVSEKEIVGTLKNGTMGRAFINQNNFRERNKRSWLINNIVTQRFLRLSKGMPMVAFPAAILFFVPAPLSVCIGLAVLSEIILFSSKKRWQKPINRYIVPKEIKPKGKTNTLKDIYIIKGQTQTPKKKSSEDFPELPNIIDPIKLLQAATDIKTSIDKLQPQPTKTATNSQTTSTSQTQRK